MVLFTLDNKDKTMYCYNSQWNLFLITYMNHSQLVLDYRPGIMIELILTIVPVMVIVSSQEFLSNKLLLSSNDDNLKQNLTWGKYIYV